MSKIFDIISKGHNRSPDNESDANATPKNIQLEIPLDLPVIPAGENTEPATPTHQRRNNAANNKTRENTQNTAKLMRELEAVRQMLEKTQEELAETRAWQADPNAPTFKERETELIRQIEQLQSKSELMSAGFDQTRRELAQLRANHNELKLESDAKEKELTATILKLERQFAEKTAIEHDTANKNQPETAPINTVSDNKPADKISPAHTSFARKPQYKFLLPAAALLAVVATTFIIIEHQKTHVPHEATDDVKTVQQPTDDGFETRESYTASTATRVKEPALHTETTTPTAQPDAKTDSDASFWPAPELDGIKIEKTEHACFIKFRQGLFTKNAELSENGLRTLSELTDQLKPYAHAFSIIIVGHAGTAGDDTEESVYETGMNRAEAVRELFLKNKEFADTTIIVRSSSGRNPPFPDDIEDADAKNRTVVLNLIAKDRIIR